MSHLKVYAYGGCDSCVKAMHWLVDRGIAFREIPIRENPPTKTELRRMLKVFEGDVKRLFNTSGQLYKAMGIKEQLETMSADQALGLLAAHGNLIKRPFVIGDGIALMGFKPELWESKFAR